MSKRGLTKERIEKLNELLATIGVKVANYDYLDEALTHRSYAAERPGLDDFERMEFFGDAVLKFVLSEYLFVEFSQLDEGQMTEIRAVLMSGKTLEDVGRDVDLEKYINVGRNVMIRPSIIARSMEAVLGAIYLDSHFEQVSKFIVDFFCKNAHAVSMDAVKDNFKAQLQQITQSRAQGTPVYSVVAVEGPPHDPVFNIAVLVENQVIADGSGRSKKAAEQAAAKAAVAKLLLCAG